MNLMFKISYGLYLLVAHEGDKHSGCVINTLMQQSSNPETISFTINKQNFTHDLVMRTNIASCAILSEQTKFDLIQGFGMRSGKDVDKFQGVDTTVSNNGCLIPTEGVLGYFDFKVIKSIDMYTHTLFLCEATDKKSFLESGEALTYDFYHKNIKPRPPKPSVNEEEEYVCVVCGYVHKGPISDDIICPICKHGREAFVPMKEYNKNNSKEKNAPVSDKKAERYICTVCGYIHEGEMPEDFECPICARGKDAFIPYEK